MTRADHVNMILQFASDIAAQAEIYGAFELRSVLNRRGTVARARAHDRPFGHR